MIIEQNINMQELSEAEYTKVYGGTGYSYFREEDLVIILPEIPTPPSGHKVDI